VNIFKGEDAKTGAKIAFSKRLAIIQITGMVALAILAGFSALWISRDYNTLAQTNTRRMVSSGISAVADSLRTITLDYSLWIDAYEAIRAGDAAWIWSNIGSGAAETGTTDLMIVVEPGETVQYGWVKGMGEEPATDLLPADAVSSMLRLLDTSPVSDRQALTRFVIADGQSWLLAISRVMPFGGPPDGISDKDLPRLLFGIRIDNALMSELGAQFLLSDLRVAPTPPTGMSSLALGGDAGEGGYAVWTPVRPGDPVLKRLAAPLLLLFAILILVSRYVIRLAGRLETAVDAAEHADQSKNEFLANISHELRTPMNGIIGIGQLIQRTELNPKAAKLMDVLMTSARSQMVLIEDLLDLSRIDSGNRQRDLSPFDPVGALNEVRDLMELRAEAKGDRLQCRDPGRSRHSCSGRQGRFQPDSDKPGLERDQVHR